MSYKGDVIMRKNINVIGVAVVLLILTSGGKGSPLGIGNALKLFEAEELVELLHKITHIMNRMDGIGQMALNPPPLSALLPPVDAPNEPPFDMGKLLQNMGPIMESLGLGSN
jgi:hypothetical protein